jgi:hypothetical protein
VPIRVESGCRRRGRRPFPVRARVSGLVIFGDAGIMRAPARRLLTWRRGEIACAAAHRRRSTETGQGARRRNRSDRILREEVGTDRAIDERLARLALRDVPQCRRVGPASSARIVR